MAGLKDIDSLVGYPVWPHTFISPSADSRGSVVSYWQKYVHEVLVNHLGGLSLPRKSVVRLTDRPDMTLDIYRGRKTTTQQKILTEKIPETGTNLLSKLKQVSMIFFLGGFTIVRSCKKMRVVCMAGR